MDSIRNALADFIETHEMALYTDGPNGMHKYDDYEIRSIKVYGVHYTKNKRDKVEFDVLLRAEFIVSDNVLDNLTKYYKYH